MTKDVQDILTALELLSTACDNIKENDQCGLCPMRFMCLDGKYGGDMTMINYADIVSAGRWTDFLEYADECLPSEKLKEEMRYAYLADYGRDELEE